jgi:hypothetical protein
MLGFYERFPINVHKTAIFVFSASSKKLQQKLVQTLHKINNENFTLEEVATPSLPQCTVVFEFGIAEDDGFNYLTEEEKDKVLKAVQKKPLEVMDFFCALRYYKKQEKKKTALKFDYYMTRFAFNEDLMEIQVFHERGHRYVAPEELAHFVTNKINETFSKEVLKALKPF